MIGMRARTFEGVGVSPLPVLRASWLFVILLVAFGLPMRGQGPIALSLAPPNAEGGGFLVRALWVQYSAASTPQKADLMIDQAVQGGFNTILYNVGCGVVVYPSAFLPHSNRIAPSFDPLKYVVQQAHMHGLQVEAWWCPGYAQTDLAFQHLHPDWDIANVPGVPGGTHWLDFSRSAVQKFVGDVVMEIATNYAVDGIQLDYIRYPMPLDTNMDGGHFSQSDVPNTVQLVYQRLKAFKPDVLLTAAVMDSEYRSNRYMQHWETWLQGGYIDYVMPMAYFAPNETLGLGQDVMQWTRVEHPERIVPGLAIDFSSNQGKLPPKTSAQLDTQLRIINRANATGYAIFDQDALSDTLVAELSQYSSPPQSNLPGHR